MTEQGSFMDKRVEPIANESLRNAAAAGIALKDVAVRPESER